MPQEQLNNQCERLSLNLGEGFPTIVDGGVYEITPLLAQRLLKNNPSNRKLRNQVVARYQEDMVSGRWNSGNPQPIIIHSSGTIIDGQHRLHAIVRAGKSISSTVAIAEEMQLGAVIDAGLPRSVSDASRFYDPKNPVSPSMVATAKAMKRGPVNSGHRLTHVGWLEFVSAHASPLRFAEGVFRDHVPGLTTAWVKAVFARAWYHVDDAKMPILGRAADIIVGGLPADGQIVDGDQSIVSFREWLLRAQRRSASHRLVVGGAEIYCRLQKALRSALDGENMKSSRATKKDLFPMPEIR